MKKCIPFVLFSVLLGCDAGVQRGQFVVGSSGGSALAGGRGWISTFAGRPAADPSAPERLLIAVIFLGQDFRTSETSHLANLSTLNVETPIDEFALTWDRKSEAVDIHGSIFGRKDGNIFIVRFENGKTTAQQIPGIVDSVNVSEILTATKHTIPDDAEVGLLEPYPLD